MRRRVSTLILNVRFSIALKERYTQKESAGAMRQRVLVSDLCLFCFYHVRLLMGLQIASGILVSIDMMAYLIDSSIRFGVGSNTACGWAQPG